MIDRDRATDVFKALSDPTRLRMVRLLAAFRTTMCVCEFVDTLKEKQYNVSKQLKVLEYAGLIQGEKIGRWTYYGLVESRDSTTKGLFKLLAALPDSGEQFRTDQARFEKRMSLRDDGRCQVGILTTELENLPKSKQHGRTSKAR